jgi:hypothetical protein
MKFETKEEARRLVEDEQERFERHRGQSVFHPAAGDHYISPEVAQVFSKDEIQELLDRHFLGERGETGLTVGDLNRSLFAADGRLVWVVTCYRPHITVVTFTVFS